MCICKSDIIIPHTSLLFGFVYKMAARLYRQQEEVVPTIIAKSHGWFCNHDIVHVDQQSNWNCGKERCMYMYSHDACGNETP